MKAKVVKEARELSVERWKNIAKWRKEQQQKNCWGRKDLGENAFVKALSK